MKKNIEKIEEDSKIDQAIKACQDMLEVIRRQREEIIKLYAKEKQNDNKSKV